MKPGNTLPLLLFAALSALSLLPGLFAFFSPQDYITFLNPLARGDGLGEYLLEGWSWREDGDARVGFIRPLASLSYIPEHLLWGAIPWPYRVTSVLIYAAGCLAVMRFGNRFGAGFPAGLLAAAAPGAVHALWLINGRGDLIAPLFGILAVAATIRLEGEESPGTLKRLLPGILCLLALASKEQGMASVPACVLAFFLYPASGRGRKAPLFLTGLAGAAAVYLAARFLLFRGIGGYGNFTPPELMPRNLVVLVFQATGAGYIPWKPLRWLFLGILAIPPALYGLSRGNFRRALLMLLLIPLFGFQSILGDTCEHYLTGPSLCLGLLTGVSLGHVMKRYAYATAAILAAVWILIGSREAGRLYHIAEPMRALYGELAAAVPELTPREGAPVLGVLAGGDPADPFFMEGKNIPMYLDHLHRGRTPFPTGIWISDSLGAGGVLNSWNGRGGDPVRLDSLPAGTVLLVWNGETLTMEGRRADEP